jgi:hypothetical protein
MRPAVIFTVGCLAALAVGASARADTGAAPRSEAAERFDRAIHLVNSGDLSGGLAEFQRAYALVPSPVVLFNLGLVYAALNRSVASARALEKALATADALKPEDVERARTVLREQGDKIGQVELSTNVKEGVVEIDNVEAAQLPLPGPLDVSGGSHVIGVISAGYAPARREVVVAGRERVQTHLDLVGIEGHLAHIAVSCKLMAADVLVDNERVGKTPLEASITVAPGKHQVEVRRAGYTAATREITLQDGARGELTLDPVLDKTALGREGGWLIIQASEPQSIVGIDGEEFGLLTGAINVPAGPHRVRVESGGFLPAERDVDVPLGGRTPVSVVFEPTPETRARYVSGAVSHRTWSWVALGVGAAAAAGGLTLVLVEQGRLPSAQASLDAVNADWVRGSGHACDQSQQVLDQAGCVARLDDANNRVSDIHTLRTVGWVIAGVGAAGMAAGAVLLLTGDNPHKYDEKPADRLLGQWRVVPVVGPGGIAVSGAVRF